MLLDETTPHVGISAKMLMAFLHIALHARAIELTRSRAISAA